MDAPRTPHKNDTCIARDVLAALHRFEAPMTAGLLLAAIPEVRPSQIEAALETLRGLRLVTRQTFGRRFAWRLTAQGRFKAMAYTA